MRSLKKQESSILKYLYDFYLRRISSENSTNMLCIVTQIKVEKNSPVWILGDLDQPVSMTVSLDPHSANVCILAK